MSAATSFLRQAALSWRTALYLRRPPARRRASSFGTWLDQLVAANITDFRLFVIGACGARLRHGAEIGPYVSHLYDHICCVHLHHFMR